MRSLMVIQNIFQRSKMKQKNALRNGFCFSSSHSSTHMALSQSVRGSYTSAYVLLLLSNRTIWTSDSRLTAKSDSVKIKWWKKSVIMTLVVSHLHTHTHAALATIKWNEQKKRKRTQEEKHTPIIIFVFIFSHCALWLCCVLRKNTAHIFTFFTCIRSEVHATRGPFSFAPWALVIGKFSMQTSHRDTWTRERANDRKR